MTKPEFIAINPTDTDPSPRFRCAGVYSATMWEKPLPEETCVETLVVGPHGGSVTHTVYETGGFRAIVRRRDGSVAGDSDRGDWIDVEMGFAGGCAVATITRRGEWWKRDAAETATDG